MYEVGYYKEEKHLLFFTRTVWVVLSTHSDISKASLASQRHREELNINNIMFKKV
jgi:hypothetical protein